MASYAGVSNQCPAGCMHPRMAMDAAQHKIIILLKILWGFFVITSHNVFNVWPKTTLLFPVRPRDAKRLDTPVSKENPVILWPRGWLHGEERPRPPCSFMALPCPASQVTFTYFQGRWVGMPVPILQRKTWGSNLWLDGPKIYRLRHWLIQVS